MSASNARPRRGSRWRWVYHVAVGLCWIGGTTLAVGVLLAVLAPFADTDDPHGGGLMWAAGVGFLPIGFGICAGGIVLRSVARHQARPDAPAG